MVRSAAMKHLALWQFSLATFLVTQLLHGVQGWPLWGIALAAAWASTRTQAPGAKNFWPATVLWLALLVLMRI